MSALREIAGPFVVAPPAGTRVRTRLRVSGVDAAVLREVGGYLGSLASADLAARCAEGRLDAEQRARSRRVRKQELTAKSSSRWAGALTRTSEDAYQLAHRNLLAERRSLLARIKRIEARLAVTAGQRARDVAAQAATGAIRYDISLDPARGRWYLDASWKMPATVPITLGQARQGTVVAVDVNAGHLAVAVLDPDGNQVGVPHTIGLALAGLPSSTRDGRLRAAITSILSTAREHRASAVVIENLNFDDARHQGRERAGSWPSRGRRGRAFRHQVAGIATAWFRDRLTHMACNTGVAVIAVDPAYTSRWGAQRWLAPMQQHHPSLTGHHAAAFVIGRRGLGLRARRRASGNPPAPEDAEQRPRPKGPRKG